MQTPNLKTKQELIKERVANGEQLAELLLDGMFGTLKRAPEYNDADEVCRRALQDLKNMDFGDMGSYIDSLAQLVDHYKDLAEHYLSCVDPTKYTMDDNGWLDEVID